MLDPILMSSGFPNLVLRGWAGVQCRKPTNHFFRFLLLDRKTISCGASCKLLPRRGPSDLRLGL